MIKWPLQGTVHMGIIRGKWMSGVRQASVSINAAGIMQFSAPCCMVGLAGECFYHDYWYRLIYSFAVLKKVQYAVYGGAVGD